MSSDFESELSWGPGNVPPGLEDAPPDQGGAYRGRTLAASDGGLSALDNDLAARQGFLRRADK